MNVQPDMILLALPDFSVNKAEQEFVAAHKGKATVLKRGLRVGQMSDTQAREHAEGEIKAADIQAGDRAKRARPGLSKVGEQP